MNNKLDESIFKFSPNETHTTNLVPFNIACETTDAAVKNSNSGTISYSASPALPGSNANNNTSFKAEKKSALHCNYYPIGSLLSIAYHNDGHYYDCTVKKHYPNTNKQSDSRKQWLFVHFTPSVSIPQQRWIDVNCIPSLRINMSDDIFTLQDDSNNRSRKNIPCSKSNITDGIDLLGKEVVVEWNSKQWRGKVTKVMKDNDHFVFIEYDNGDQSWCDLQNENSWATVPEHNESSSSLLHARTRSSKIVEKEEKGDDISYSNRNNSHITAATTTTTTTNNKKQKYYHDHYQQQPLVTEEQEEKRMHKARKEEYYNTIPSQSRSPPALHIEYPDQNDILFGRGWDIQNRPGNLLFRQVLESYLTDYNKLESRKVKSTFACAITSELKERHHCRFLMKDPTHTGGWHEVTDTVARQKVSSGFRDIRKAHVKNYNSRCEQEGIKIDKAVEYDSDDNDDDDDDDGDWVQGN